jgi:hypothetical protein
MTRSDLFSRKNYLASGLFIFVLMVLSSTSLSAQSEANFSGVWLQDNSKSDPYYRFYNVKVTITQTPEKINIITVFLNKDGKESTSEESFNLDGKEVKKEQYGGTDAMSASWSADKKTLITKTTRTVGSEVYGSTTSYSLSDNGYSLIIQTEDIKPGQPAIKQVLIKKQ